MTRTTNTTRLVGPKRTFVQPAMAINQKATNPTDAAETETHTTTSAIAATSLALTETETTTESADIAMTDTMTDTTTCSTPNRVVTLATMTGGIATGGAAMTMTTVMAIVARAVEMLASRESLDSPSGKGRPWACSRTTHSLSSRRRVPSMSKNKWQMALEGAEDCGTSPIVLMT